MLLTFCPPPCSNAADAASLACELVFIIDRSGSMAGASINSVRDTLHVLLRSLPTRCRFNLVGFGSDFTKLWPGCLAYDERSLQEASEYVKKMEADMGGTEVWEPLADVLKSPADKAYPRQVFLLTGILTRPILGFAFLTCVVLLYFLRCHRWSG
jgi:von Willebrand factor A domain-containing protein 5